MYLSVMACVTQVVNNLTESPRLRFALFPSYRQVNIVASKKVAEPNNHRLSLEGGSPFSDCLQCNEHSNVSHGVTI